MAASGRERIILPLDVASLREAQEVIGSLHEEVGIFKVGLELFTAAGPKAVRAVHDAGCRCFLDLKLHDIPTTVCRAIAAAMELGVAFLTVHAVVGPRCLREAAHAAIGGPTRLLAVTLLTSLDEEEAHAIGLSGSTTATVLRLGRVATEAGITGLVCSPAECAPLRVELGRSPLLVVPGVRPAGSRTDDQVRVASPAEAVAAGADLLVIGRPIRTAADPSAAARAIAAEIELASP